MTIRSSPANRDSRQKLPAFGREILELRRRGLVPANERGVAEPVYVLVDTWDLAKHRRYRVVVPKEAEPADLEFAFVAGIDVFVIWRMSSTSNARRDAVLRALVAAAPRFLFVIDWEAPEHGFVVVSFKDGLIRPEYGA